MAFYMPTSSDSDNQALSGCDHCVLNLFGTCLRKIGDGKFKFAQIQPMLLQLRQALEQGGFVCLTADGAVNFMTHYANNLLRKYFPDTLSNELPGLLEKKFSLQLQEAPSHGSELSFLLLSRVEKGDNELLVHWVKGPNRSQYLLILEEKSVIAFSVSALELLGLTRREAEVLFWVTKDKSNISIARKLGCCEGTVRKHLENIYKKLEVQTRIGAVMSALRRLGLLREEQAANW